MDNNPICVEVTRGTMVESVHRGAMAIMQADGTVHAAIGACDHVVYPRSAIKLLQALPLMESGAADAYAFSTEALSLAGASHNGEDIHADKALAMLQAAGLTADDLECGAQAPKYVEDHIALAKAGRAPTALHNNCSGKHAGMLAFARHSGLPTAHYIEKDHPVQRAVKQAVEDMLGIALSEDSCGTDGCSIPTWGAPLRAFASAFAKVSTGNGLPPERASACARLLQAAMAAPYMVAGKNRACTAIMQALPGRVFAKVGAEGVYCAALPELGLGLALKVDDGAFRAAECMLATALGALLPLSETEKQALSQYETPVLQNWNKRTVGGIRPSAALRRALAR